MQNSELTERQSEVLGWVIAFIGLHQYPPSLREIGAGLGMSYKRASDHLIQLSDKHRIRFKPGQFRTIQILDDEGATDYTACNKCKKIVLSEAMLSDKGGEWVCEDCMDL